MSWFKHRESDEMAGLRAEVQSLQGHLAADVSTLDPGPEPLCRQAMADASKRDNAAGTLLSRAPAELRVALRIVVEGLHATRVVREHRACPWGRTCPPSPPPATVDAPTPVSVGEQHHRLLAVPPRAAALLPRRLHRRHPGAGRLLPDAVLEEGHDDRRCRRRRRLGWRRVTAPPCRPRSGRNRSSRPGRRRTPPNKVGTRTRLGGTPGDHAPGHQAETSTCVRLWRGDPRTRLSASHVT